MATTRLNSPPPGFLISPLSWVRPAMIHSCLLNHFEMPWPRSIPGESRIGRRVIIFTMGFLLAFVLELFSPAATSGQAFDQQPGQVAVASESLPLRTPPAIAAIGHIEPGDGLLQISATSYLNTFVLGKLFVAEGDFVPKGHVLAHLDAHGVFEAAVGVAQKALEATKERQAFAHRMMTVGEVPAQEARIQKLQAELAYLEADHKRTDFLRSRNLVSSAEQESTLSRRQAKTEEVQEAVHLHRSLKEKWAGELRQAEIAIGQAECALKRAQAEFALCQIRAPVAGRILEIHTREGEAIRSKGVLSLGETDRMYAVAEVYQADVPKIKPGAKARVTADGLGLELSGVVERIGLMVTRNQLANPDIAADIDSRVVKVRIRLDQPELVAGLTNLRVTIGIE